MRIAPPSLPPHHCSPATNNFQSFILVEVATPPRVSSGERLKKHRDVCEKGMMEKSDVVEHVWENQALGGDNGAGPWQGIGTFGEGSKI